MGNKREKVEKKYKYKKYLKLFQMNMRKSKKYIRKTGNEPKNMYRK